MSRFWAANDSSDSDAEPVNEQQVNRQAPAGGGRFGANYDESDSGDIFLTLFYCKYIFSYYYLFIFHQILKEKFVW
jgi:hypothetical protein